LLVLVTLLLLLLLLQPLSLLLLPLSLLPHCLVLFPLHCLLCVPQVGCGSGKSVFFLLELKRQPRVYVWEGKLQHGFLAIQTNIPMCACF
jgi:hypothetical protein